MRVPDLTRVRQQGPLKHRASWKGPVRALRQCWLSPHLQGDSSSPPLSEASDYFYSEAGIVLASISD